MMSEIKEEVADIKDNEFQNISLATRYADVKEQIDPELKFHSSVRSESEDLLLMKRDAFIKMECVSDHKSLGDSKKISSMMESEYQDPLSGSDQQLEKEQNTKSKMVDESISYGQGDDVLLMIKEEHELDHTSQGEEKEISSMMGSEYQDPLYGSDQQLEQELSTKSKMVEDAHEVRSDKFISKQKTESDFNEDVVTIKDMYHFQCGVCKKGFSFKSSMINHQKTHLAERPFKCDICNKSFQLKRHMKSHLLTHIDSRPFKCDICNKSFNFKSNLNSHLITHTNNGQFQCEICSKGFSLKSSMVNHQKTHLAERPFKCDICNKSFQHKCILKLHLLAHTDSRSFKCDICYKSFHRKGHLSTHLLTHTDTRPFKCNICYKSFRRKSNVSSHLLTHSDTDSRRPTFKCDICKKSFKRKDNLSEHMVTHTNNGPYQCEICRKSFYRKYVLNGHMVIHSNSRTFNCQICNKSVKRKVHTTSHTHSCLH